MHNKIKITIIIIIVMITVSISILISLGKEKMLTTNIPMSGLAIYVYNNTTNNYVSQNSIPQGNYILNTTSSYCDGIEDIYIYNKTAGTINYSIGESGRCYLYFDIGAASMGTGVASEKIINLAKNDSVNFTYDDFDNVRYIGANPNNYVCFDDGFGGCINYDKDDAENKPAGLFRIIGVFNEDSHGQAGEQLVKLISADALGNASIGGDKKSHGFGSCVECNDDDYGSNDWSDAQLMYMLNGAEYMYTGYKDKIQLHTNYAYNSSTYYISDGTNNIYQLYNGKSYLTGNGTTTLNVPWHVYGTNYSINSNMQTLLSSQANMIEEAVWHLGASSDIGNAGYSYKYERGTTVYGGHATTWTGKIGLMYPSDVGYSTSGGDICLEKVMSGWDQLSECYENAWIIYEGARTGTQGTTMDQLTITPVLDYHEYTVIVNGDRLGNIYFIGNGNYVRPSFYLKSNVIIKGGSGTSTDPYRVGYEMNGAEQIVSLAATDTTNLVSDTHGTYTNIRYVGANPNNYACFDNGSGGCINYNKDNATNKPAGLFRIIGVFNEDTHGQAGKQLVKLISADSLGNVEMSYDCKQFVGSSTDGGSDDWSDSQVMYMLNGFVNTGYNGTTQLHTGYSYNSSTYYISDGTYNIYQLYNGKSYLTGNGATSLNVSYDATTSGYTASTNTNMQTLLTSQANMIATVTWHLGGTDNDTPIKFYTYERGTETCYSMGNCSIIRPTTWIGKIGLMYPSDYGYATSGDATYSRSVCINANLGRWYYDYYQCAEVDWINYSGSRTGTQGTASGQWTISTTMYSGGLTYEAYYGGDFYGSANDSHISPTFYLESETYITGGSGTSTDPYRFTM